MSNILVKTVFYRSSPQIRYFIKTTKYLTFTLLLIVLLNLFSSCDKAESNLGPGSVTQIEWTDAIHGRITDTRDNIEYAVVLIGDQVWLAENFAYNAGTGSWAYNDDESNVTTYGRLYDWATANSICPIGWHLPNDAEWNQLAEYISNDNGGYNTYGDWWQKVGDHLKSTYGWNEDDYNGTDDYDFTGLPGGFRSVFYSSFDEIGKYGFWWSATEWDNVSSRYWVLSGASTFGWLSSDRGDGFSVRYIKD